VRHLKKRLQRLAGDAPKTKISIANATTGAQMKPFLKAFALMIAVLGSGAATVILIKEDIPDLAIPQGDWRPGTLLDGIVFYTTDTIVETGDVIFDELRFADGTFQSSMCQIYCDFGWSDYQTWQQGDVLHFTATTRCPDAPHTVVFHGTVTGDAVEFEGTWTTRRWYWTHQVNVTGFGTTTRSPDHVVES
jgi:hypothetical protein